MILIIFSFVFQCLFLRAEIGVQSFLTCLELEVLFNGWVGEVTLSVSMSSFVGEILVAPVFLAHVQPDLSVERELTSRRLAQGFGLMCCNEA